MSIFLFPEQDYCGNEMLFMTIVIVNKSYENFRLQLFMSLLAVPNYILLP